MTWFLILTLLWVSPASVEVFLINFKTRTACEDTARNLGREAIHDGVYRIWAHCVEEREA